MDIKSFYIHELAKLAQYLEDQNALDEATEVDRILNGLARTNPVVAVFQNREELNQLEEMENPQPEETAPQRSVLKIQNKGMIFYPLTAGQLRKAVSQYGLVQADVMNQILRQINPSAEEYAATSTLDDAIKLAVKYDLLEDSWF